MITVDIHEVVANFSDLLDRLEEGEVFTIMDDGKPIALLSPIKAKLQRHTPGIDADRVLLHPDFDDPLPEFDS
jgi:antitoxin (DNA-binding transcriptional repressor) of toxin-antitoxin stability system